MKVIKEFDNKLLKRKEIEFDVDSQGTTLSRLDIKSKAVKALKADEKLLVVSSIASRFGSTLTQVIVYVYEDEQTLKRLTPEHVAKRNEAPVKEEA
jgi:ribosomal protein S24E